MEQNKSFVIVQVITSQLALSTGWLQISTVASQPKSTSLVPHSFVVWNTGQTSVFQLIPGIGCTT